MTPSNPFSTRWIRPGCLPFLGPDGQPWSPAGVSAPLDAENWGPPPWHGQIVGPHGSGKTTLLHHLRDQFPPATGVAWWQVAADGRRWLERAPTAKQVFIDGWEQLSYLRQYAWLGWARWTRRKLLVTTHRVDARLPVLWTTTTSPSLLALLAARLTGATAPPDRVQKAFEASRGNLREALFWLYDAWEADSLPTDRQLAALIVNSRSLPRGGAPLGRRP